MGKQKESLSAEVCKRDDRQESPPRKEDHDILWWDEEHCEAHCQAESQHEGDGLTEDGVLILHEGDKGRDKWEEEPDLQERPGEPKWTEQADNSRVRANMLGRANEPNLEKWEAGQLQWACEAGRAQQAGEARAKRSEAASWAREADEAGWPECSVADHKGKACWTGQAGEGGQVEQAGEADRSLLGDHWWAKWEEEEEGLEQWPPTAGIGTIKECPAAK